MKAVFLDFGSLAADQLDPSPLLDALPGIVLYDSTPDDDLAWRIGDAEFVLTNKSRLEAGVLAQAAALRYVGLAATGTDNVDTDYASRHGIAVTNIRSYCTRSVVEHVFGVLLGLTRSLERYRADVRAGQWQASTHFSMLSHPLRELHGLKLGIIGFGELGRAVARVAECFGMEVMVSSRPGDADDRRAGRVDFDELLRVADVISLHCPLTDTTAGLFSTEQFDKMKTNSIFINTARGGLVDSAALVDALATGAIGAAAIDVLSQEPPADGDPLLDYAGENLILTPHIAWAGERSRQQAIDALAENVRAFLDGRPINRVV